MRDFKEHPEYIESKNIKQKKIVECLNKIDIFNEEIPIMNFRKNSRQNLELYLSLKDDNIIEYKDKNDNFLFNYILKKLSEIPEVDCMQPNQDTKEIIQITDKTNPEHYKRFAFRFDVWSSKEIAETKNICHLSIYLGSSLPNIEMEIGIDISSKNIELGTIIKPEKIELSSYEKEEIKNRKRLYKEWIEEINNASDIEIDNLINTTLDVKYNIEDKISINNGPFNGLTGRIKSIDKEILTVELNMHGEPITIEININDTFPRYIYLLKECQSQQIRDKELYSKYRESKIFEKKTSLEWLKKETIKKLRDELNNIRNS